MNAAYARGGGDYCKVGLLHWINALFGHLKSRENMLKFPGHIMHRTLLVGHRSLKKEDPFDHSSEPFALRVHACDYVDQIGALWMTLRPLRLDVCLSCAVAEKRLATQVLCYDCQKTPLVRGWPLSWGKSFEWLAVHKSSSNH